MELIVAVDEQWGIGKQNDLLVRISEDLRRFRELTTGNAILIGKRTLDSFPNAKPLPNRVNIVLCFPDEVCPEGVVKVCSVDEAVREASKYERVYVSGGESVYRQFLPYCTRAHITKVYHTFDADRFFPNLDEDKAWKITDTSDLKQQGELTYQYITYERTDHDGECI